MWDVWGMMAHMPSPLLTEWIAWNRIRAEEMKKDEQKSARGRRKVPPRRRR